MLTSLLLQGLKTTDSPDYYGTVVTEVQIITGSSHPWTPTPSKLPTKPPRVMTSLETLDGQSYWPDYHPKSTQAMCPAPPPDAGPHFETTCSSSPASAGPKTGCSGNRKHRRRHRHSVWARCTYKLKKLDPVKLAYLRTSFIFAISVLVTWAPSSINRVHNLLHKDQPNFPLNVASAVVLPLQGVWNAVIYFITSWGVFRAEIGGTAAKVQAKYPWLKFGEARRGPEIGPEPAAALGSGRAGEGPVRGGDSDMELEPPRMNNVRALRGSF